LTAVSLVIVRGSGVTMVYIVRFDIVGYSTSRFSVCGWNW